MNETRTTLFLQGREIILIGTAHVSKESIDEVTQTVREEKPDMICVELDEGRYRAMTEKDNWERLDVVKVFKEGKGFLLIANLVLASFQRRMGQNLGVQPGDEMKAAVKTALELGIPFTLCDREINVTLRRAWANCSFWNKMKLLTSLLASSFTTEKISEKEIEDLKNRSELDGMMKDLSEYLPPIKTTLIDERDCYLAAKIWSTGGEGIKQVAVVGAGHLKGIQTHLEKITAGQESADISNLNAIPPKSFLSKVVPWLIPIVIVGLIAIGFFRVGPSQSFAMLGRWLILNGSLAAFGTLIALGHPLSILVSFLGAPIGTLSPVISVGLFSGMTEAWVRPPRVSDAEAVAEDVSSIKGIYGNRILKALLVFFLASIGGAVGNFISIPALAGLLF
ncbi:MAG: TraB/GumN family protein [Treponema sp.]|nr:TraB/GumN family protein [Treponema sp.]